MMLVWFLRALTYHPKGIPYRAFFPKRKKALEMGLSKKEAKKAAEYESVEEKENYFMPEE